MEELATVDEREAQVELLGVLERELERANERIVDLAEHGAFRQGVRDLGPADDVRLLDDLEGVDSARVLLPDLHDLAKAALADDLEQVKVGNVERPLRGLELALDVEAADAVGRVDPRVDGLARIEDWREFDAAEINIVAHVGVLLTALRRVHPQVRRQRNLGRARDVAALSNSSGSRSAQEGFVHPGRIRQVTAKRIDHDLVLSD